MNKEHKYTAELLIDYADGLLDPTTEARIREILEHDEDARGVLAGIHTFYESHGKDRGALEKFLGLDPSDIPSFGEENIVPKEETKVRSMNGLAWKLVGVAAMVTLIVTIWTQTSKPSSADLIAMYIEEVYEFPTQSRGDDHVAKLLSAYSEGDYSDVVSMESEIQLEDSQSLERLVIALSYFQLNDWENAEARLLVCAAEDSRFSSHAHWHLALVYCQNGKGQLAMPILQQLAEAQGYRAKEAAELLSALRN